MSTFVLCDEHLCDGKQTTENRSSTAQDGQRPGSPKMKRRNGDKNKTDDTTRTGRMKREKTINMRRLKREHQPLPPEVTQWLEALKPRLRSECRGGMRPCPHVSCKYHLYLDVNPETGSIKFNFPGVEVHEMNETCALDVAERGGVTLEEVGVYMNLTRERIRQVESTGIQKVMDKIEELDLTEDLVPDGLLG